MKATLNDDIEYKRKLEDDVKKIYKDYFRRKFKDAIKWQKEIDKKWELEEILERSLEKYNLRLRRSREMKRDYIEVLAGGISIRDSKGKYHPLLWHLKRISKDEFGRKQSEERIDLVTFYSGTIHKKCGRKKYDICIDPDEEMLDFLLQRGMKVKARIDNANLYEVRKKDFHRFIELSIDYVIPTVKRRLEEFYSLR
ncbi:MAG: hypothetical protein AB1393_10435 [Candidatus Edwardsbacteria bacterium]